MTRMPSLEAASRLCLTLLMALAFFTWGASGVSAPALDQQFDEPGSFSVALVHGSGDSSSPEPGAINTHVPGFPLDTALSTCSPSLFFVEPPARFLSYPALPQGPPVLV